MFGITGKRNDEEDAKEKLYTYVSLVPISKPTEFRVRSTICSSGV